MSLSDSHPSAETLADYDARRLPPSKVLAVSDHLADCAACRDALARLHSANADAEDTGEPGYEDMAALLDGTLTPERAARVRARLEASPRATLEFEDLRAFRDESAARPLVVHGPAAVDEIPAVAAGKIIQFPGWAKFALSAAAAVLLSAGWWHLSVKPDDGRALLAGINLDALPADLRQGVEEATRTGHLHLPPLPDGLRPAAGMLAGEPNAPSKLTQVTPVGEVVREVRPRLRWNACPEATGYVVYLGVMGGSEPLFRQELPANRTDWPPPKPLARGAVYEWQVEARHDGEVIDRAPRPPAPESRFEVMSEAAAGKLDAAERTAAGNALILGTAYEQAGLRDAAAGQFRELARQHPGSAVAARLADASAATAAK